MKQFAFLILLAASAASAQTPMTAEEFDAYTRGKTFYYAENGQDYGGEEYLPDRRVRWSFLDGQCKNGHWYEEAGQICFVYEDRPDPQCWTFFDSPAGLVAQLGRDPQATLLYETRQSPKPMTCLGPEVGV
ncbi:hypothetical protein ACSSNL_02935 [Thalassobius sp. S69A]|uniref:hypothetical protein n=1 Tax=unclassified Thalassovita TaxID=2619711 RepID=UPI000C549975|nr:hypothetical protein [Paracoccaceae bacterium]